MRKRSFSAYAGALGIIAAAILASGCEDTYETYQYQGCTNAAGVAVDPSFCRNPTPGFVWYYYPHPIVLGSHPIGGSYSRTVINNNHWYSSSPSSGSRASSSSGSGSSKGFSSSSGVSRGGFGSSSFGGGS